MSEILELRGEVPTSDLLQLARVWKVSLADITNHLRLTRHEQTRIRYEQTRCSCCRTLYHARKRDDTCPTCYKTTGVNP